MKKLILKCHFAVGDIVMLTAAVRDLHLAYPGRFATDVRTSAGAIWENNPHLTPLKETGRDVSVLESRYPLIDHANERPYHCLHGFIEFLNGQLGLAIKPTAFHGDIHLSSRERSWFSQVYELIGTDIPFWIVGAGGKYDIPIKWWSSERYQAVIDHFRGRIQFVQVGEPGHYHPKIKGAIDLRGKTDLRQLIRLMYHAQGVLCGVTGLMHLAAAIPPKDPKQLHRPAVVIGGGREPATWEAYPHHQFIHTNGALPCCAHGGCWQDRVVPLGDGDEERDQRLCSNQENGLPRCMEMISAEEVIHRIGIFFAGGQVRPLTAREAKKAMRGVLATQKNEFDDLPIHFGNARLRLNAFVAGLPGAGPEFERRGIVIPAGGSTYLVNAWVAVSALRRLGCRLPIEIWHLGPKELDKRLARCFRRFEVRFVDALRIQPGARRLGGWELKAFALLHSTFAETLLLDADNVPVADPTFLFESEIFLKNGALFWPDLVKESRADAVWKSCDLARPPGPEFESGQIVVDKKRCWRALRLALWFNENSDFYYRHLHGDKETFHLAFEKLRQPYEVIAKPAEALAGAMVQHDFRGGRIFLHRNMAKWKLSRNKRIAGFDGEAENLSALRELRSLLG